MTKLNLAIVKRKNEPISLKVYLKNTAEKLKEFDIDVQYISTNSRIPSRCDLVWEPALAMRRIPRFYKVCDKPIVATMHGVKAFSMPMHEITSNIFQLAHQKRLKRKLIEDWEWFGDKVSKVVAVSHYGQLEVQDAFNLPANKTLFIHNAIDHNIFNLHIKKQFSKNPYLFHVSSNNPIKNIERIIEAYQLMPKPKPELVMVIPGYKRKVGAEGIKLIRKEVAQTELARWYRGAVALVFPSLRETFGMPVLEAMACGCPVITSNITGCSEIAGSSALQVNPRSVDEIKNAMTQLTDDQKLRRELIDSGLDHAKGFTWEKCASQYYHLFNRF